jgi:hypothetical protein
MFFTLLFFAGHFAVWFAATLALIAKPGMRRWRPLLPIVFGVTYFASLWLILPIFWDFMQGDWQGPGDDGRYATTGVMMIFIIPATVIGIIVAFAFALYRTSKEDKAARPMSKE